MFKRAFCAIALPTRFDVSFSTIFKIINHEFSTGTRILKVTLQDHETLLSGLVGSKLRISGRFPRTN